MLKRAWILASAAWALLWLWQAASRTEGPIFPWDWLIMAAPVVLVLALRRVLHFIVFGVRGRPRYRVYRP